MRAELEPPGEPSPPFAGDLVAWRMAHGSRCALCPLNSQRKVGCEGPLDAPLILLGEAPGAEEEKVGRPFVGRSGQLLFRALHLAGLEDKPDERWWVWQRKRCIKSVLLVNTIMCRPPGNKIASPEGKRAVACCKDSAVALLKELSMMERVVVPLGGTALDALTGEDKISLYRGRVLDVDVGAIQGTDEMVLLKAALKGKKPPAEWNEIRTPIVSTPTEQHACVTNHEKIIKCILAWNRRNLRPRKPRAARAPRKVKQCIETSQKSLASL